MLIKYYKYSDNRLKEISWAWDLGKPFMFLRIFSQDGNHKFLRCIFSNIGLFGQGCSKHGIYTNGYFEAIEHRPEGKSIKSFTLKGCAFEEEKFLQNVQNDL